MNFTTYKYFIAIAQADSIKHAADSLMISPQALSEHMRKLEQELGVELFTHTRPARLSPCGERFLRYAETMVYERYQLEKELRELADKHREIVLSVPSSDFPPFVTDVIAAFTAQYPSCLVTVMERANPVSAASLSAYDLNISTESLSNNMTEIVIQGSDFQKKSTDALSANYLSVLVQRNLLQKIWSDKYKENLEHLLQESELSIFQDVPFIRFMNSSHDAIVDEILLEQNFLPHIAAKSSSAEVCLTLCASGVGAMVIPDGWAIRKIGAKIDSGELELFRLKTAHPLVNTIISYRQNKTLTEEEQTLIDMMRAYVARL